MNNFEKIKNMTIEEMAKLFACLSKRCINCTYYDALPIIYCNKECFNYSKQWLESEVGNE